MKNILVWAVAVLAAEPGLAESVTNIVSVKDSTSEIVRVLHTDENRYVFEYCWNPDSNDCRVLGRESGYGLRELHRARRTKRWQALGIVVLDTAIVGASATAGVYVIGPAVGALFGGWSSISGAFVGGPVMASASTMLVNASEFLNPARRWREAHTIAKRKLNTIECEECSTLYIRISIRDYAYRLEKVLTEIN